jgi:hypothetical protein
VSLAAELESALKKRVDIVPTKKARCEVVLNAFSTGIPLHVKNEDVLKRDYFKNYRQYDQNAGLRRIRIEHMKRGFGHGE